MEPLESLRNLQKCIRKYSESGHAKTMTETETRQLLINPLLAALGWDISDLDLVRQG